MSSTNIDPDLVDLAIRVVNSIIIEVGEYNQITNKINVKIIFPQWLSIHYDFETQLKIRSIIKPYLSNIIEQKLFDEENKCKNKT